MTWDDVSVLDEQAPAVDPWGAYPADGESTPDTQAYAQQELGGATSPAHQERLRAENDAANARGQALRRSPAPIPAGVAGSKAQPQTIDQKARVWFHSPHKADKDQYLRDLPPEERSAFTQAVEVERQKYQGRVGGRAGSAPDQSLAVRMADHLRRGVDRTATNVERFGREFVGLGSKEEALQLQFQADTDSLSREAMHTRALEREGRIGRVLQTVEEGFLGAVDQVPNIVGSIAAAHGGPVPATLWWWAQTAPELESELRRSGVDPETARSAAAIGALPIAAIEVLQVGQLSPQLKAGSQKVATTTVRKFIADRAKKAAGDFTTQMGEELAQEVMELGTKATATYLAKNAPGMDWGAELAQSGQELLQAAKSMPFLMGPGQAIETAVEGQAAYEVGQQRKARLDELKAIRASKPQELKQKAAEAGITGSRSEIRKQVNSEIKQLQEKVIRDAQALQARPEVRQAQPRQEQSPAAPEVGQPEVRQDVTEAAPPAPDSAEPDRAMLDLARRKGRVPQETAPPVPTEAAPTAPATEAAPAAPVDEARVQELMKRRGWDRKTGRKDVDSRRESEIRQEVADEAALLQQYPPGTKLKIPTFNPKQVFVVGEDGKLRESFDNGQVGRKLGDNAGAALLPYQRENKPITVVSQPETAPAAPEAAPPAPEPVALTPREQAQQAQRERIQEPVQLPQPDERQAAKQVETLRQENKRKRMGRKDQAVPAPQAPTSPPEAVPAKEPWQMTRKEYMDFRGDAGAGSASFAEAMSKVDAVPYHRDVIRQALAAGKPVPPEVLADYPELAQKAPTSPQNASEATAAPEVVPQAETLPEAAQEPEKPKPKHSDLPMFSVYPTQFRGVKKFAVKEFDRDGFGDAMFGTEAEAQAHADRQKQRREEDAARTEKAKSDAEAEQKRQKDYEGSFGGFLSSDPKTKGRQLKVLGTNVKYKGTPVSRKSLIESKVADGWTVTPEGRLQSSDGSFLDSRDLTETGIKYARHLAGVSDKPKPVPAPRETALVRKQDDAGEAGKDEAKPKRGRKRKSKGEPQTLMQAVQHLGGLSGVKLSRGERINIREDLSQFGLLGAMKGQGGTKGTHDLEEMARELESGGYWRAPEGDNKGDALLQALKSGAKTLSGMEADIAREYEEHQQELRNAIDQGIASEDIEATLRSAEEAGFGEAEATQGEAAEVLGELDDSFDFGANESRSTSVPGEQQGLFQSEPQGSLFNVSRPKGKKSGKAAAPQRSELERIDDELRAVDRESLPGQKDVGGEITQTKLQKAAEDAIIAAEKEAAELRRLLRSKGLFSNPMLDPEIVAAAARVVYKYAKAGTLKFAAFTEQLAKSIGQQAVDALRPELEAEWNKLYAKGEFDDMEPVAGPSRETTGTKNAKTDELRSKTGMGERPPIASESREQWQAEAARRMAEDPEYADRLADEVVAKPRALDSAEEAVLGRHIRDLENRRQAGEDVFGRLATAVQASEAGGTEWSRAGTSRQTELAADYSLAGITRKHIKAVKSAPTDAEMKKYAEQADRIEKLETELNETNRKLAQAEIDKRIAEAKAAPAPATEKKGTKRQRLQQTAAEAVANFKQKWAALNQAGAVSDPKQSADKWIELTKAAGDVVKAYADLGVDSFLELMSKIGKVSSDEREAFREAWGKREKLEATERLDPATVGEVARKQTRFAVESGLTEREEVIDAVHEELRSQGFDVSREETMAAMAAKGVYRELPKKEVNAKIRSIKAEIRRSLKKTSPAEEAAKKSERYKKSLEKRLAMWEAIRDEAARGKLPKKRKPTPADDAVLEKKWQIEQVKRQAEAEIEHAARAARSKTDKVLGFGGDLLDLAQSVWLGLEASPVLLQGAIYTYGHPLKASRAVKDAVRAALSRRADFAIHDDLMNDPNRLEHMRGGLDEIASDGPLSRRDEFLRSRLASWLADQKGTAWAVPRWAAEGILGGERFFRTFMNRMRVDLFNYMKASVDASRPGTWSEDDAKEIGYASDAFGGRGRLPFGMTGAGGIRFFLAPRWVWSRVQVVTGMPLLRPAWKGNAAARNAVAKVYVRAALGFAAAGLIRHVLYSLLADDDEHEPEYELDPRSSDFGKMRLGETRISGGGGLNSLIVLAARVGKGETKTRDGKIVPIRGENVPWGADDTRDVLHKFLDSKLGMLPSAVLDWIAEENVVGEKATTVSVIADRTGPLTWRDIYAAEKELGVKQGTVAAIEAFFGGGVSTYGDRTNFRNADEAGRQEIVADDLENMHWSDPERPAYAEFLTSDQLEQFRKRREQKRGLVVYNATYDGDSEDTLKTRDKNVGFLQEMRAEGVTYEEAERLLKVYYETPTKKEREADQKAGRPEEGRITKGERPGYNARRRKLRELYGE